MKNLSLFLIALAAMLSLNSCQLVGDIFKAGMGFGIFIVIAVIGVIIFIISKASGRSR
ncbi:MAG: hypothetical protein H7257_06500 [Taibaiella sp.]|nr:hypothetical protein [Taibaiella sp.]